MLTDGQKAQVYLRSKGISNSDFAELLNVSPQRASQLLGGTNRSENWGNKISKRVKEVTNGGLDVDMPIWDKIGSMLAKLPSPKSLEKAA